MHPAFNHKAQKIRIVPKEKVELQYGKGKKITILIDRHNEN